MSNPKDTDSFTGDVGSGNSFTLSVETQNADRIVLLVDNGTTDSAPATYDLTERIYSGAVADYLFNDKLTDETARSWKMPPTQQEHQYEVVNASAGTANYRAVLMAV